MGARVGALLVVAGCIGLMGCVSADVYRIKEQEVRSLQRTNEEAQDQNRLLLAAKTALESRAGETKKENEGLQNRVERQSEEIGYLRKRTEKLEKDGEQLRDRVEKQGLKIVELNMENQRLAALSRPENLLRTLGERLTELQKQVEALAGENATLKNEQVAARTREEVTDGAEQEHAGKAEGEKPQAIPVSAMHKSEEISPDQQLDEREQPAVSEDREKRAD